MCGDDVLLDDSKNKLYSENYPAFSSNIMNQDQKVASVQTVVNLTKASFVLNEKNK